MVDERKAEHRDQKQEQRERQGWDDPIGKLADVAVALANEALTAAIRNGYRDAIPIRSEPDFTQLISESKFRSLLDSIGDPK